MRLYYKLVGSGVGDSPSASRDADIVIDDSADVVEIVKDRQGALSDLAEQAWCYRELNR